MKRHPLSRRLVFLLSAFIGVGSVVRIASAATVPPIKLPKKQIRIVRTECLVVATEAKRIVPGFSAPEPFGRELYSRISENVNSITVLGVTFRVLDLLEVPDGRDVLGGQVQAPSGPGWQSQYLDTGTPTATQRHHYGFYFFTASNDGGQDFILGLFGNMVNDVKDIFTSNQGDHNLADEAVRQGALARAAGVSTVSGQVKGICTP
jgi:hypothetical protein